MELLNQLKLVGLIPGLSEIFLLERGKKEGKKRFEVDKGSWVFLNCLFKLYLMGDAVELCIFIQISDLT